MSKLKSEPVRIETGATRGWQVRFYYKSGGRTKYQSKLFSDSKCGGNDEAYEAAIRYRDEHSGALPEEYRDREIEPYRKRDRRNNSGVTGITFYKQNATSGVEDLFKSKTPLMLHRMVGIVGGPEEGLLDVVVGELREVQRNPDRYQLVNLGYLDVSKVEATTGPELEQVDVVPAEPEVTPSVSLVKKPKKTGEQP